MRQHLIFVVNMQPLLALVRNSSCLELQLKGITIDDLKKATTKNLMYFHCSSNNLISSIVSILHLSICVTLSVIICVICG